MSWWPHLVLTFQTYIVNITALIMNLRRMLLLRLALRSLFAYSSMDCKIWLWSHSKSYRTPEPFDSQTPKVKLHCSLNQTLWNSIHSRQWPICTPIRGGPKWTHNFTSGSAYVTIRVLSKIRIWQWKCIVNNSLIPENFFNLRLKENAEAFTKCLVTRVSRTWLIRALQVVTTINRYAPLWLFFFKLVVWAAPE